MAKESEDAELPKASVPAQVLARLRQAEQDGTDKPAYYTELIHGWIADAERIEAGDGEVSGVEGLEDIPDDAWRKLLRSAALLALDSERLAAARAARPAQPRKEPADTGQDMLPELGASPN